MDEIKIVVVTHKKYQMPEDDMYVPVCVGAGKDRLKKYYLSDDTGENISDRNAQYSELTALYWAWKNLKGNYLGIVHYRRHVALKKCHSLNNILSKKQALDLLEQHDVLVVKHRWYLETVKRHYINCHRKQHEISSKQIEILGQVINDLHPGYNEKFWDVMNGHSAHMFNMFVMERSDLDQYCAWLFEILFEAEERINQKNVGTDRLMGSLSEFLLDVWLEKNKKDIYELELYQTEMDFWKRVRRFLYRRFFEK